MMILLSSFAYADSAFDLAGPHLDVKVTRADKSLRISEVAHLQAGDKLWIRPAFSEGDSVHYLLVVAFLRGATNPPPDDWFVKAKTWDKKVQQRGITVTVPEHAQQAAFFLAPETTGDFTTLRSAVRGRPGAFIRAIEDLNLATESRLRAETYLSAIRDNSDSKDLEQRSKLLARSLKMKIDEKCFDRPRDQRAPCLMQNSDQMVLDDEHGQSKLVAMATGPEADLVGAVSVTTVGGAGIYSPYVGVIVDLAKVMANLHTAQFQYIPALALPEGEQLNLKLNNPPSFHKPKSVLVAALPPITPVAPPALTPVSPKQVYCLQNPSLVLEVDGAPAVFSTDLVHDLTLHLEDKQGKSMDARLEASPAQGGLVLASPLTQLEDLGPQVAGSVRGNWGFESYQGPTFQFRNAPAAAHWRLLAEDENALVVGREDSFHIHSDLDACVQNVSIKVQDDSAAKANWRLVAPDDIEVKVSLADAEPGRFTMAVKQFGVTEPISVPVRAYAEEIRMEQLTVHAGEQKALLKGARLDQVSSVDISGTQFVPVKLARVERSDELSLIAQDVPPQDFQPQQKITADVKLKDGRDVKVRSTVKARRPRVALVDKTIQDPGSAIRLGSSDDLPLDGRLTFFVKSQTPSTFPHDEKIEIASADGFFRTVLSVADKNLTLQDSQTAVGTFEPLKAFGDSAFGPLRLRAIAPDGSVGEWQSLVRLVRAPRLREVRCPDDPQQPCTLKGEMLFLIDSISSDKDFANPVSIPSGYAQDSLSVPRPNGTVLYMKLRDDPVTIQTAVLPVLPKQFSSPVQ